MITFISSGRRLGESQCKDDTSSQFCKPSCLCPPSQSKTQNSALSGVKVQAEKPQPEFDPGYLNDRFPRLMLPQSRQRSAGALLFSFNWPFF